MEETNETSGEVELSGAEKSGAFGASLLTLLVLALIGLLVFLPNYFANQEPLKGALEVQEWWVTNLGQYHPVILHLPIGIVFLVLLMEGCRWLTFGKYRPMTGVALFFAFITGVLACVTGFFDLQVEGMAASGWDDSMYQHMWLGIIFVGVLGLTFLAKIWGPKGGGGGPIYALLLLGTAGVMGYGSHLGGMQTHGEDPFRVTMEGLGIIEVEEKKIERVVEVKKEVKDRLAFAEVVMPILDTKCLDCHSQEEGRKKRGGLLMDSYANLLIGGSSQDGDEYRTLVPGDASKSYMIEVLNLPMDDDMHMPPPKRTQMEAAEIEILTWWVNSLPAQKDENDVELVDLTLEAMAAPQAILDAVSTLVSPEELAAEAEAKAAAEAAAEATKAAERESLQNALNELKQDEKFSTALNYISQDSSDLEFTAVSLRENFGDEDFGKLLPVAEAVTVLKIGATSVSEGLLMEKLPLMKNVMRLDLSQTAAGDGAMEAVAKLDRLEWLNLYGTPTTDEGLMKLKGLSGLKKLYLWNSQATPEGADKLKQELPGLEVVFGVN